MQGMRKKSYFDLAVIAAALPICDAMFKSMGGVIACNLVIMWAWMWLPVVSLFCFVVWAIFMAIKDPPSSPD